MAIARVMFVQAASQALPIVAAFAVRGRHKPVPYPRVVVWCLILIGTDMLALVLAKLLGNNLWLSYVTRPIEVFLTLWVLSLWQPTEYLRLAYSLAIPVVGALVVSVLMLTDPTVTFSRWMAPPLALLALAASLHTLVHRTLLSRAPLARQDWFWICLGMSLFWLGYVSVPVFADAFLATHEDWVWWAYVSRAYTDIAAFILMSWGIWCQRVPARSFGSS
ncbi:MAG: hypothetical protein ACHQC8_07430 [Solirubrobacterales bacterium]